jgi:hypothetical protein
MVSTRSERPESTSSGRSGARHGSHGGESGPMVGHRLLEEEAKGLEYGSKMLSSFHNDTVARALQRVG